MDFWCISTSGNGEIIGTAAAAFEQRVGPEHLSISMFKAEGDDWTLDILYDAPTDLVAIMRGLMEYDVALKDLEIHEFRVPDENWVAKSLEDLPPICAGRFFVHGGHNADDAPAGLIPIHIEAGEAFGTGHHGSTEGCLAALSQIAQDARPGKILDLGTGSGLLAIAAAKIWRSAVLATDIDPIAVKVAHENARLNGVQSYMRTLVAKGTAHAEIHARAPFDLIVANILARPLRQMAGDIAAVLAPGGYLILSGILKEQGPRVEAIYRGHHITSQQRLTFGDWVTLICRKG